MTRPHAITATLALAVTATPMWRVKANEDLVSSPEEFSDGMHCATVGRRNTREEIFTSPAAIEAVKKGEPIPIDTVITLVDHRDGKLFHYVVMENRTRWGAEYPPEKRSGEWEFLTFDADRSVNHNENLGRSFPAIRARLHVHIRSSEEREVAAG
jgi:hypothetical protein